MAIRLMAMAATAAISAIASPAGLRSIAPAGAEADALFAHPWTPVAWKFTTRRMTRTSQQPNRLGEVLCLGFVEVEDHWHEAEVAEFVSQLLQDHHPAFSI
jgi:hypothetical protein